MSRFFALAALLLPLAAAAEPLVVRSVPDQSRLEFIARYESEQLPGAFAAFRVEAGRDPQSGAPQYLLVTVDTGSADMNDRDINDELGKPDWFNSEAFPEAVYEARRIVSTGAGSYTAEGQLKLKGVSLELTVPFGWEDTAAGVSLSGETTLSRRAWNVGMGEWAQDETIADNVTVTFSVVLR